ncbi:MAG: branched-chain amino acid transport system II carrier protein [Spirochaetaceae bacterium]|nr:branched-chain amino acid transport system II carrier protein [Spirochaetaceae bacterium]
MNKKHINILIVSFALFAMYFGAGNLIFPPMLGATGGKDWLIGLFGFLLSEVGLIAVGLIAATISDGKVENFAAGLPKWFSLIIFVSIALILGPLFVVPRTAATTFEIAILPIVQDKFSEQGIFIVNCVINAVFFLITLVFVLTPTSIIDKIGKFLTPCLLVVLAFLIFKGIFFPLGPIVSTENTPEQLFALGIREGYQTMDALAAILFGAMVINSFVEKGYNDKQDIFKMSVWATIGTCIGLAVVYAGLAYLGAAATSILPNDISRTTRLVLITQALYGPIGTVLLSLSVSLACLTTSIGLIGSISEYFQKLFSIPLKPIVVSLTIFSFFISIVGVESIITFAAPVLEILYPIVVVLFFLSFFSKILPNYWFKRGAVIGAAVVSFFSVLLACDASFGTNFASTPIYDIVHFFPFSDIGIGYFLPSCIFSLLCGFIAMLFSPKKETEHTDIS